MGARGFSLCVVPRRRRLFSGRDGTFHPLRTCPDYCKRFAIVPAELGITGLRWLRDETEYQQENRGGTEVFFHWCSSSIYSCFTWSAAGSKKESPPGENERRPRLIRGGMRPKRNSTEGREGPQDIR